jgi:hypothetical protein
VSDPIRAEFFGGNKVKITHDGDDGFGSVFLTDDEAEKLRVALYACTKKAREREDERRAEAAKPKTVRVRIAVAVGAEGDWVASGAHGNPDQDAADLCLDDVDGHPKHVVYVTADVPLPVTPTVEGECQS